MMAEHAIRGHPHSSLTLKMNLSPILLASCAMLALVNTSAAQGADLCGNAQPIAGLGIFNFDNTLALTDGLPDPLCLSFGLDTIDNDVWFAWTAPTTGTFIINTCGQTVVDTKIGIYDGSCVGAVLACNDDTCALQSQATWQAIAGQVYVIRLGNYPGAAPGTGTFTLAEDVPTFNPANGSYYQVIDSPGISWTQAMTDAANLTYLGVPGHLATLTDQAENDFVFGLGDVHYRYIGGFQNLSSGSYAEPGGGWEWITGEAWTFSNWLPNEPNDSGPNGAEDFLELLQGGSFGTTWNDTGNDHSAGYIVEYGGGNAGSAYCFGDGTGLNCPCSASGGPGEGCANTTATGGATLTGAGSPTVSNDSFRLDIDGVPGAKPGLILKGNNQITVPAGDGILCTSGGSQRSHVQVTVAGSTSFTDFNGAPFGSVSNLGIPTNFQFWYRDPANQCTGAGFNFTNGWTVTYQP
ncbi:MAG: hypothetical protein ACI9F9_003047 [Candidatus Paceibacteria bacterium]|jgi:hypothetical protein